MATYGFSEEGTQRIVAAVRKIEGRPVSGLPGSAAYSNGIAQSIVWGKTSEKILTGNIGKVKIWRGDSPGFESETDEEVDAYNAGPAIEATTKIMMVELSAGWCIISPGGGSSVEIVEGTLLEDLLQDSANPFDVPNGEAMGQVTGTAASMQEVEDWIADHNGSSDEILVQDSTRAAASGSYFMAIKMHSGWQSIKFGCPDEQFPEEEGA